MPSNKEELSALLLSLHGDLARVQSRLDYLTSEVGEYHGSNSKGSYTGSKENH